jgi:hypothetical protein
MLSSALIAHAVPPSAIMPWNRPQRPSTDPGLTSRHLPASLEIGSEAQLRLFRTLAGRVKADSTRHWEISGGRLRISYDLLMDLTGGNLPNTGGGLGERFASFLSGAHGMEFRSGGTAHGSYLPNDKWVRECPQWALKNPGIAFGGRPGKAGVDIDIDRVWDKFGGSDSLVIAVVDAGFDFNHPDLKGRNWINQAEANGKPGVDDDNNGYVDDSLGWDFVENDNLPQDYHGHGTFTSSAIAAGFDNREGIAGALAQAKIMPVRVLDASGHGDESRIAKGILYAVKNGAKAINFSIGGDGDNADLRKAFQTARDSGVPIIVAAGNDTHDLNVTPAYPASYNYDNMLVVAAHDHAGLLCSFSNFGKTAVHLAAPGEFILAAGLPDPKEVWKDDFEGATLRWSVDTNFKLSTATPVDGKQSLAWASGNNVAATALDTLDLTGVKGATIRFRMDFKAANTLDVVIVEGNKIGTSVWTEVAVIGGGSPGDLVQDYGLQDLDGSRFRLRFRTSLNTRFTTAGRALRIDDISVAKPDADPPKEPVYTVTGGTSLAAPYVTAYVGLQRLACDRMGLPWTRARALTGVADDPDLAGKVSTNGRLDVYRGLEFYLSTLPDFRVTDSTATIWTAGRKLEYDLSLSPAPDQDYAFSGSDLPPGAAIDGAGRLTWNPSPEQAGEYTIRLLATGPTILRKALTFSVQQELPVAIQAKPAGRGPEVWRWGGQAFRLRPELLNGSHLVEVFGTDAAGKVQLLKRDWMDAGAFRRAQGMPLPDAAAAVIKRLQIRVDGIFLAPGA